MAVNLLGYEVTSLNVADCASAMIDAGRGGRRECLALACLNPHSYVVAKSDLQFARALTDMDWLVPDGVGVVLAAKILRMPKISRVTGPDIMEAALHRQNELGGSVFFLGSTPQTLSSISDRVAKEFPNVRVLGAYSPPFRAEFSEVDSLAMVHLINQASPDILWVGLTAPKQEKWILANRYRLEVGSVGAVGAAFDFFSGQVQRSSPLFRKTGFEWLPRLLKQPRRLWQRTFISAPIFLFDTLRASARKLK